MSVILGYKMDDKIYLAADNRVSTSNDIPIRDNACKIVIVNNNVAVALAGYGVTQTLFENIIKNSRKSYNMENILACIQKIYWFCKIICRLSKVAKNILYLGSRFIIAGKNEKGKYCIYTVSFLGGKLEKPELTEIAMYPPSDVSTKVCYDAYAKNVKSSNSDFMQKTIKDIAKVSKLVSSSGDVWTYDMKTGISRLEHFI